LRQELSLDVVPHLCQLRTIPLLTYRVRDFVVLATYSGKPDTLAIPLCEKTTAHWEWEMERVTCTHPMNLSGAA